MPAVSCQRNCYKILCYNDVENCPLVWIPLFFALSHSSSEVACFSQVHEDLCILGAKWRSQFGLFCLCSLSCLPSHFLCPFKPSHSIPRMYTWCRNTSTVSLNSTKFYLFNKCWLGVCYSLNIRKHNVLASFKSA